LQRKQYITVKRVSLQSSSQILFMKKISWIAGLVVLVVFSGCFDTLEEVTINENGSGTFINSLDMGKLLGLAKTMGSGNDEMKDLDKLKMDTVIHLKDIQDSLKNLNAAEKKIAATGTLNIQMDASDEKMKFEFTFPFSKTSEIAGIQDILKKAKQNIINDIMQKIMGEKGSKNESLLGKDDDDEPTEGMSSNIDEYYTSVFEKGKFTRKLNKEKYAHVEDDKSLKSLQEMAQLGMPINMKTIINLPKPAKKAEGKGVKLSDDKKKVTVEGTLDDFFESAAYFEYDIEY
jgi:hypothetical protein